MLIQFSHEVLEFTAWAGNGMSPKTPSIYYLFKNIAKIKYNLRRLIIPTKDVGKTSFNEQIAIRDHQKRDNSNNN